MQQPQGVYSQQYLSGVVPLLFPDTTAPTTANLPGPTPTTADKVLANVVSCVSANTVSAPGVTADRPISEVLAGLFHHRRPWIIAKCQQREAAWPVRLDLSGLVAPRMCVTFSAAPACVCVQLMNQRCGCASSYRAQAPRSITRL